jgi:hypothetical protein
MATNDWGPYQEYYLFVCHKCMSQIMNLLEDSVSIPIVNDKCNTYISHSGRYIRIYGLAKRNDNTWKLSNSMRRRVRDRIIDSQTANAGGMK